MAKKKFKDEQVTFQRQHELSADGAEICDPQRVFVPVRTSVSLEQRVRLAVRQELSKRAAEDGMETFEEANDFEIDDPWDTYHDAVTPYVMMEDEYPIGAPDPETPPSPNTEGGSSEVVEPPNEAPEHPDPE